jgi:MFS family permease
MFAFLVGLFLFALDNTIVADVQPAIVAEFHSVDKIEWLATAFFLSATGTNISICFSNRSFDASTWSIQRNI